MSRTVTIGGREYPLRCDLNVLAELEHRYGKLESVTDAIQTLAEIREIGALMINEAAWADGRRERVSAQTIGRDAGLEEAHALQTGCLLAFYECIYPGKSLPADGPEEDDPAKKQMPGRTNP